MRTITMILAAMGLALCAAPYAGAELLPALPRIDKFESAKSAEIKGDLAHLHNNNVLAVAYYQQAVRVDPKNPDLYNKLGIAELKLNNHGSAHKHFGLALKYDPRNVSALNNLGAVSFLDKKYKPAVRYLKQALELDETSAPAHLNLGEAWIAMGELDHGMTEYARALELDADILSSSNGGMIAQIYTPEQRARISFLIAKAYARRGNVEGAFEYLRRAKEGSFPHLADVYQDKDFAPLWGDPRLEKIAKK